MILRLLILVILAIAPVSVSAKGGMVAATDPLAAEAGREMLRSGGSAADAAMAVMLTLSVIEPQSSGIGGGGFLIYHDAKTGEIETIDGRETAPAAARPDRFLDADRRPLPFARASPGGYSVGVPGNIALMAETHKRWGKLKWAALFAPAIRLAEQGFAVRADQPSGPYVVYPWLETQLARKAKIWKDFPEARSIYWKDGAPPKAGTIIRNPAMAATLREIAAKGPDAFYKGGIAAKISAAVEKSPINPTALTAADLSAYEAKGRPATCRTYRGYRICGMGSPSSGAAVILMMLKMLERFDIPAMGKDSPAAWHLIGEAMRLAYADRDAWLGDTDFVDAPFSGLLDPDYLASRSKLISPDRTIGAYEAGNPPGAPKMAAGGVSHEQGTSHFVVADSDGDVASMTSTVEGAFGSQIIAGGFFLNNEMTDFSFVPEEDGHPVPNRVQPGKRPLSSMAPTIVYAPDGKPWLAVGSGGGRTIIMHVLKTLIGTIDWKLSPRDAITLPNIFFRGSALIVERNTSLEEMIPVLARLGETPVAGDLPSRITVIQRVGKKWTGAADPRSPGVALAQ
jgi:gamma-glutamyltranspeptidase/glutathione hydrolase